MIEKVIRVGAQDNLNRAVGQLITVYEDRRHVKQAASGVFSREDLLGYAPPPGHFMAHIIAMGSDEQYGFNRNHDGWPHQGLINKHATFVTHGRNYREHRNTDPKLAIGKIAASRYDEETQRVELILHTCIEKAAEEFERARSGEEMSGSMAANLPEDQCNACDHISKTAYDRCDCIRNSSGLYLPGKRKYAYMINNDPTFKDYSWVRRPADRIAFHLEYGLPKAANFGGSDQEPRGDELARQYGMGGVESWEPLVALKKLAAYGDLTPADPLHGVYSRAFQGQFGDTLISKMAAGRPERWMRQLVDKAMVMPLETFHAVITDGCVSKSAATQAVQIAKEAMPVIRKIVIRKVESSPEFGEAFGQSMGEFEPSGDCGCDGDIIDSLMDKAREQFSTRYADLCKRAVHNPQMVVKPLEKQAKVDADAFALGTLYQAYLLKTAEHMSPDQEENLAEDFLPGLLSWAHLT